MAGSAVPAGDLAQMSKTGLLEEVMSLRAQVEELTQCKADLESENRALRESEGRLATVVDHMPAVVFVRDIGGRFALINRGYEETYGVSNDGVRGKTLGEVFPKDVAQDYAAHDRRVLSERQVIEEELDIQQEGAEHVFSSVKFPILDTAGEMIAIGGIEQDITERKRAEAARAESEAKYRRLVEGLKNDVFFVSIKPGGEVAYVSPSVANVTGYTAEECLTHWYELVPEGEARDKIEQIEAKLLQGETPEPYEVEVPRKDGTMVVLEVIETPVMDTDNRVVAFEGVYRDVTQRRRAEEALQQSQARLDLALHATGAGVWDYDLKSGASWWSDELYGLLGYAPEELEPSYETWVAALYPEDRARMTGDQSEELEAWKSAKATRSEYRLRRKDSSFIWVEDMATATLGDDGQVVRQTGVMRDITVRKQAEEALRERESFLTSILESSPVGGAIVRNDGRQVYVNDRLCEIFGKSKEALLGTTSGDLYYVPSDQDAVMQRLEKDGALRDVEVCFRKADGSPIWALLSLQPTEYQGESARFAWIYDITDRKAAQEELEEARDTIEEAQARLTDAIENMSDAIVVYDVDGRLEFCNSRFKEFYGYTDEEIKADTTFDDLGRLDVEKGVISGGAQGANAYFERRAAIRSESNGSFEVELSDGRWLQIRDRRTSSGGIVSVQADITERKQAEAAIRQSEERFRTLVENTRGIIYRCLLDEAWTMEYIGGAVEEITGYPQSDFQDNAVRTFGSLIHPDDADSVTREVEEAVAARRDFSLEYRILHRDGSLRWILSIGQPVIDSDGTLKWLDGTLFDITDRKQAEEIAEKRAVQLRAVLDQIPAGVYLANADLELEVYNEQFCELYGFPDGLVYEGQTLPALIRWLAERGNYTDMDIEQAVATRVAQLSGGAQATAEQSPPTGRPIQLTYGPTAAGGVCGVITDITERKKAEAEMERGREQLNSILESSPVGIAVTLRDNGQTVYANARFAEQLGLGEDRHLGRDLKSFWVDPQERDRVISQAKEAGIIEDIEVRRRRSDGSEFWALMSALPIAYQGQEALLSWTYDITERKKAEDRFRALLESAPDATVIVRQDGKIVQINQQTERLFGYASDELLGQAVEVLVPERLRSRHPAHRDNFFGKAKVRPMGAGLELFGVAKGGHEFPIEISLSPIETEEGMLVSAAVRDITERKRVEQELQRKSKLIELLSQTAEAANKAASFETALAECLTLICKHIDWPVGHAYVRPPDGAERMVCSGIWYLSDEDRFKAFKEISEKTSFESGVGLPGSVMAGGRPEWIDDVTQQLNFVRGKGGGALGLHSAFAAPVIEGTDVVAVLEFFTEEVLEPDESTLQTFQALMQVGDQLGQVIRRVRAEAELREIKERLDLALEGSGDGLWDWNAQTGEVYWDERWARMLDYELDELEKTIDTFWRLMHPEDAVAVEANLGRVFQSEALSFVQDFRLKTKRGEWLWILSRGKVIERDDDGGPLRVMGTHTDISERKKSEEELRTAKEQAEAALADLQTAQQQLVRSEKMASLGQLTAGIAHEIKNPLNFVNNFSETSVELLGELEEALEPVQEKFDEDTRDEVEDIVETLKGDLEKVKHHGKRADGIVRSMLLHARGDEAQRLPTGVNDLVDEALNLAYHGERARDTSFQVTMERNFGEATGEAAVLPQEITRVLVNIFSNAFYAVKKRHQAAENGYEPTVTVWTEDKGEEIEIRIRDNGTGMPEEVREKLFDPFFTTKPTGEGTGLGMSMSFDIIVQQHGGRIDVASEPGAFTEFVIALPRQAPTA